MTLLTLTTYNNETFLFELYHTIIRNLKKKNHGSKHWSLVRVINSAPNINITQAIHQKINKQINN